MPSDAAAITAESPRDGAPVAKRSKRFAGVDGRSAGARRLKDLEAELAAPLGGLPALAPAERLSVQSAALLTRRLEQLRSAMADGDLGASDEDLIRVANALARAVVALDRLAAARKAKVRAPSLADVLRAEAAA
jgi:hypothetical protein